MTNEQRQHSLEEKRIKDFDDISACGHSDYCNYCLSAQVIDKCCCAKAYNRMVRATAPPTSRKINNCKEQVSFE